MKKSTFCIFLTILVFAFSVPIVMAGGNHGGDGNRSSITINGKTMVGMSAGSIPGCRGGVIYFMEGFQQQMISGHSTGNATGSGGNYLESSQYRNFPGGSQSMYQESWSSINLGGNNRGH